MSTSTQDIAAVLNSLIQTCKDGQEGFRSAAEDVKNADYKALFTELSAQRQQFAADLQRLVRSFGEESEDTGSVAGALHRSWIDLKAAISSGDEHAVLAECERGEDVAVEEYREALKRDGLPPEVHAAISQQSMAIKAAHDRVRELRDRTDS